MRSISVSSEIGAGAASDDCIASRCSIRSTGGARFLRPVFPGPSSGRTHCKAAAHAFGYQALSCPGAFGSAEQQGPLVLSLLHPLILSLSKDEPCAVRCSWFDTLTMSGEMCSP